RHQRRQHDREHRMDLDRAQHRELEERARDPHRHPRAQPAVRADPPGRRDAVGPDVVGKHQLALRGEEPERHRRHHHAGQPGRQLEALPLPGLRAGDPASQRDLGIRAMRTKQSGVVLFIALIVLVVMTLAGIAMMRQVGTGVIIAGNLAFKSNATSVGDLGVEDARAWLVTQGSGTLSNDGSAQAPAKNGYFSSWDTTFNPTTYNWTSGT